MSVLSIQDKLADAVTRNNISLVDEMLRADSWLSRCRVSLRNYNHGWPVVHHAAMYGQAEMVRVLAKQGFSVNAIVDYNSPMDLAVKNDKVEVVKQLLTLGAEVDETIENDKCKVPFDYPWTMLDDVKYAARESPLRYAIRQGYTDIVTCISTTFRPATQRNMVGICLALAPLQLPAYIILWIIDWLPEYERKPEITKIRLIQSVTESVRRAHHHRV